MVFLLCQEYVFITLFCVQFYLFFILPLIFCRTYVSMEKNGEKKQMIKQIKPLQDKAN